MTVEDCQTTYIHNTAISYKDRKHCEKKKTHSLHQNATDICTLQHPACYFRKRALKHFKAETTAQYAIENSVKREAAKAVSEQVKQGRDLDK